MKTHIGKAIIGATVVAVSLLGVSTGSVSAASSGKGGPASRLVNLTAEQRTCLDNALSSISPSATRPERRTAVREATRSCGIWKQYAKLAAQARSCVEANGVTSGNGLPSKAQKRTFRSLAAKCGFQLRTKG
ncbi:MAG: hypothetical protein RL419_593 [Actinomycetota bacterium]|jgi:hypothetical protein